MAETLLLGVARPTLYPSRHCRNSLEAVVRNRDTERSAIRYDGLGGLDCLIESSNTDLHVRACSRVLLDLLLGLLNRLPVRAQHEARVGL
jgi:hypothetical protein